MSHSVMQSKKLKVALVQDWLVGYAGGEKVLEHILLLYPDADIFSVVDFLPPGKRDFLLNKASTTTFIQRLPFAQKKYRSYLPLMPLAIEQLDLSAYDLVISSSHSVAKGVLTGPDQVHVCYVHSPIRYAWDLQHQYLAESGLARGFKGWIARAILHYMRLWDTRTANGVDVFIANSRFIARRIEKAYRRSAEVIPPPVEVSHFQMRRDKEEFYLTASRMVPYKMVPLIIEAFAQMTDRKLVVIGEGPEFERAKSLATPNVSLLGYQSLASLVDHMQRAKGFVFAAEEDFGITPLEAQACGTPVIAYGKGGSLETVRGTGEAASRTGVFFHEQSVAAIVAAIAEFESLPAKIDPAACRAHAEKFSPEIFRSAMKASIERALAEFRRIPD